MSSFLDNLIERVLPHRHPFLLVDRVTEFEPRRRIAGRHILPNMLPPLLVQSSITVAAAIIAEASLSFLGLGQQPPAPSWGSMLNAAQRYLSQAPWMALYPGLAIFAIVLALNVLGDGLRDVLDPKHR